MCSGSNAVGPEMKKWDKLFAVAPPCSASIGEMMEMRRLAAPHWLNQRKIFSGACGGQTRWYARGGTRGGVAFDGGRIPLRLSDAPFLPSCPHRWRCF